jgi:hypothetical protein
MKNAIKLTLASSAVALLAACGGGGSTNTQSGTFINSPTKGIKYSASPSGLSGVTDENGKFTFQTGDTVTFSLDLGASVLTLGSVTNPSATTSVLSLSVPNGGDPLVVAQVLETLDKSSIDGKMDVSGISLPSGNAAITAISSALSTSSVSAANISSIATAVQTVLTASAAGNLKNGVNGVSVSDAMSNLSKNTANQSLLETKVQNLSYDGTSSITDLRDKVAFTSWIIKSNGTTSYFGRFGLLTTTAFDYRNPYSSTQYQQANGTYTVSNNNRTGNWTGSGEEPGSGTFTIKTSDSKSFVITYSSSTDGESGSVTGTFLMPLTLADIKSKSYTIPKGCSNGSNNVVSINSVGIASDTCGTSINGSTWSNGPFVNTLQYKETNGTLHYVGVTRLDKKGGVGNLPTGAVGALADISNTNYSSQPEAISFIVN